MLKCMVLKLKVGVSTSRYLSISVEFNERPRAEDESEKVLMLDLKKFGPTCAKFLKLSKPWPNKIAKFSQLKKITIH